MRNPIYSFLIFVIATLIAISFFSCHSSKSTTKTDTTTQTHITSQDLSTQQWQRRMDSLLSHSNVHDVLSFDIDDHFVIAHNGDTTTIDRHRKGSTTRDTEASEQTTAISAEETNGISFFTIADSSNTTIKKEKHQEKEQPPSLVWNFILMTSLLLVIIFACYIGDKATNK